MKLVDTNIFLEILLEQSKAKIAKDFFVELVKTHEPFIVTSFTIHSIIVILERKNRLQELQTFINSLAAFDNIIFYYPNFKEEKEIIGSLSKWDLDFDDAFQYFSAKKMHAQIVTFDHDFMKLTDIAVQLL